MIPVEMLARLHSDIKGSSVNIIGVDINGNVNPPDLQGTAQPIIDAFDASLAAHTAWLKLQDRSILVARLVQSDIPTKLVRSLMLIIRDELNLHALKMNAMLDAADNAATFAAFKTAMAAIPDYPQRTIVNLITALTNKINAGDVD